MRPLTSAEVSAWLEERLLAISRGRVILPGLGVLNLVDRAARVVRLNRRDGTSARYQIPARQMLVFRLAKPRKRP
jgi:nucleoid DNA-binding protein